MLHLPKISTFSTAIDHIPDIIQDVRIIFETSDTQLFEALCDIKAERKNDVRQKHSKWLWRKILFDPEHSN